MTLVVAAVDTWRLTAACHGMATNIWYPTRGQDVRTPKAVCATCPVKVECLEYALQFPERHGIFGGLTERERRRLRARQRLVSGLRVIAPVVVNSPSARRPV